MPLPLPALRASAIDRMAVWGCVPLLRSAVSVAVMLGLCCLLGACAIVRLGNDLLTHATTLVVIGRVQLHDSPMEERLIVVLKSLTHARTVYRTGTDATGTFELSVPRDSYSLSVLRKGASPGSNHHVCVETTVDAGAERLDDDRWAVVEIDLAVASDACREGSEWDDHGVDYREAYSTLAGRLVSLDDPALSSAQGAKGYWEPMDSLRIVGANVWALEPIDGRIPVAFVPGALGSAQDLRALIESLDRNRFQAWIFVYPSGAPLGVMSIVLRRKLHSLLLQSKSQSMAIAAHSMGGLVSRAALTGAPAIWPARTEFISLATPWGGDRWATTGVRQLPVAVPSWHDMRADGRFLRTQQSRGLPDNVRHHLIFGYRGGATAMGLILGSPNNDGVVDLRSMLEPGVQKGASSVTGFDEDHLSLLSSPGVMSLWGELLERMASGTSTARSESVPGPVPSPVRDSMVEEAELSAPAAGIVPRRRSIVGSPVTRQ